MKCEIKMKCSHVKQHKMILYNQRVWMDGWIVFCFLHDLRSIFIISNFRLLNSNKMLPSLLIIIANLRKTVIAQTQRHTVRKRNFHNHLSCSCIECEFYDIIFVYYFGVSQPLLLLWLWLRQLKIVRQQTEIISSKLIKKNDPLFISVYSLLGYGK